MIPSYKYNPSINPPGFYNDKALIYQSELDHISKCVLDYPDIETGGDLFGSWTTNGHPIIHYTIGPGKNANHQLTFFNQDAKYMEETGKALREKYGIQHIGTWHSHHRLGLPTPSGHDIKTVVNAIKMYNLPKFLMVVCSLNHENACLLNACMLNKNKTNDYDKVGWVVLSGQSLVRKDFDTSDSADFIIHPKTLHPKIDKLAITTIEEPIRQKPDFPETNWLNSSKGMKHLQLILKNLKDEFGTVKIWKNADNTISLFLTDAGDTEIKFPVNYPDNKPEIRTAQTLYQLENGLKSLEIISKTSNT